MNDSVCTILLIYQYIFKSILVALPLEKNSPLFLRFFFFFIFVNLFAFVSSVNEGKRHKINCSPRGQSLQIQIFNITETRGFLIA